MNVFCSSARFQILRVTWIDVGVQQFALVRAVESESVAEGLM